MRLFNLHSAESIFCLLNNLVVQNSLRFEPCPLKICLQRCAVSTQISPHISSIRLMAIHSWFPTDRDLTKTAWALIRLHWHAGCILIFPWWHTSQNVFFWCSLTDNLQLALMQKNALHEQKKMMPWAILILLTFEHTALGMAKTLLSFGNSECNSVNF